MEPAQAWILDGDVTALTPVALAVRRMAEAELGEEGASDVELALVEAVTNVIRHGYGPEGGPIRVEVSAGSGQVVVRLFDWGRPIPGDALAGAGLSRFDFDPADIDALPSGGLGLSIIASVMDKVTYRSDEGQNVLTLLRRHRP